MTLTETKPYFQRFGFCVMKFVHHVRDRFYGAREARSEARKLLDRLRGGDSGQAVWSIGGLLEVYRGLDRARPTRSVQRAMKAAARENEGRFEGWVARAASPFWAAACRPTPGRASRLARPASDLFRSQWNSQTGAARSGKAGWTHVCGWALMALAATGCQTASYLSQAVHGQYQIMTRERLTRKLLADPQTPPVLKNKLRQVGELRRFAKAELALPVDGHYLRYADLHRRYVVWDVYAAPEFSLEPKAWWYPVVGRLTYRGYFSEADAARYASQLREKGFDVYVEGVEAYSTLGWFRDPVLNTCIFHPEIELAESLFHELAHQRLFVAGDTEFDEAFATATAEDGVRRWLAAARDAAAQKKYEVELERKDQVMRLVMACRRRLDSLYATAPSHRQRGRAADQPRAVRLALEEKQRIFAELRRDYAQLRAGWDGACGYDRWFAQPLNNAQLNAAATYYHLVPAFHCLRADCGGDLKKFYRAAAVLARLPQGERHRRLDKLLGRLEPDRGVPSRRGR